MEKDEKVYTALKELGIDYEKHEHPPVYTVAEAQEHWEDIRGSHVKNLFMRDEKGKKHFLVIMPHDKKLDMKDLQQKMGTSKLSFASERRLEKYLGLTTGSVSLFGILNDEDNEVEVIIDSDLLEGELINFHPNVNTATLTISTGDMKRFLEENGNRVRYLNI